MLEETETFIYCSSDRNMTTTTLEQWQFLKMLNKDLLYDPEILLDGTFPRELKTYADTKHLYMNNHSGSIHDSQK